MDFLNPFSVREINETMELIDGKMAEKTSFLAGLFGADRPTMSNVVEIEERGGTLKLIQTEANGGPGVVNKSDKRKSRFFKVPRIVKDGGVEPADIDRIRIYGGMAPKMWAQHITETLGDIQEEHYLTHAWHRVGAIKGQVLDADGSVLHDSFTEFGITKKLLPFALATPGTNVREKAVETLRLMEDGLMGDTMTGAMVYASPEFMTALVGHPKVEAIYAGWQAAQERLGGDYRSGFTLGGLTFVEVAHKVDSGMVDGNGAPILRRYVEAGKAHAVPNGTSRTFRRFIAPGDFNDTVNKRGQLFYGRMEPRRFGRGFDMHTQSNVLTMCLRPGVLVELSV
jgi:hypothetical protein